MSNTDLSCGLDYTVTPNLQACLNETLHNNYSFMVTPIVHPRFRRYHVLSESIGYFTRSDMILSPHDWTTRIVGKVSPYINVDVKCPKVRQRYEDCLNEELGYCRGLGLPAVLLNLHGCESENLARILLTQREISYHSTLTWVKVPMICNKSLRTVNDPESTAAWDEPWHWWSLFHERMEWDKRTGVVLELTADIPPDEVLKRWLGEPVKAIVIPTFIFHNNKKGFPVLSRAHQELVGNLVDHDAQVIISGSRRSNIEYYVEYLHRVKQRRPFYADDPMLSYAKGWEDFLQIPLQPLADNLDTHTYNVFEKDPVKYMRYQKAVVIALNDLKMKQSHNFVKKGTEGETSLEIKEHTEANKQIIIMVLGAGRGPLVRATLNAADLTESNVKVIAVEKNPCALVALRAQVQEVWRGRNVQVFAGDMRSIKLETKADIIISELLGSWGDNELSPECLDGAMALLKPGGISIPQSYTSYVGPISSPSLWAAAKAVTVPHNAQANANNLENIWVVYMQNKHDIGKTKKVFTFDHPNPSIRDNEGNELKDYRDLNLTDNRRNITLEWKVEQDNVVYGFGGYFDCDLYGGETLSIVPETHSEGMISWFPVFIPIKTPLRVSVGDEIRATFWRCVDTRRVWYEWTVRVGTKTTQVHNTNGRSSEMLL